MVKQLLLLGITLQFSDSGERPAGRALMAHRHGQYMLISLYVDATVVEKA
jgi:hypothetical protein